MKQPSVTHLLKTLIKKIKGTKALPYEDLVKLLGEQGLGMVMVLFALPNALPISMVPGFSFIFGLPIIFIAVQLILGRQSLWLPRFLAKKTVDADKLIRIIKKTLPYLLYIERLLKPRWDFFSSPFMEKIHGIILLFVSLLLILPIPFSNFIFGSLIICFGLGIATKDGILLAIANLGTIAYVFVLTSLAKELINYFS